MVFDNNYFSCISLLNPELFKETFSNAKGVMLCVPSFKEEKEKNEFTKQDFSSTKEKNS